MSNRTAQKRISPRLPISRPDTRRQAPVTGSLSQTFNPPWQWDSCDMSTDPRAVALGAGGCRHLAKFLSHAHAYARMGEVLVKWLHPPAPSLSPTLVQSGTKPDAHDPTSSLPRLQDEPWCAVSLLCKLRACQSNFAITNLPT